MQHVARVLACLDPDGASAEEWDEILHAQAVSLWAPEFYDRLCDAHGVPGRFLPDWIHPQEAMERAGTAGLLPAEFLGGGRHFFNVGTEPLCSCSIPTMDADLWCHRVNCRLMTYKKRTAYVLGTTPVTEAQVFSILMRAPEMIAVDRLFLEARQILWCPRNHVTTVTSNAGAVVRPSPWFGMGLWARQLGDGVVAIGVPPVKFDSCDPGPYTALERGVAMHKAIEAKLAARPTFA